MKNKILKLNVLLFLGLVLSFGSLQGQPSISVRSIDGTQTKYLLSAIRKLTYPTPTNMAVVKFTGSADNYVLADLRNMIFADGETGIKANVDDTDRKLFLHPNPVVNEFNIQLSTSENQPVNVEIVSIDGKILYKAKISGTSNFHVDFSQFQSGFYLCRINNGLSVETIKFLKK